MDLFMIVVTLLLTLITSLYWGTLLSDRLPEFDARFDRKPFNCRPCLSFHLMWILSVLFSIITEKVEIVLGGFILALLVFFILRYIDNKMIIK